MTPAFAGCTLGGNGAITAGLDLDCRGITEKAKRTAERDATRDSDKDGLTNQEEVWWATDPSVPDTDSDGTTDGDEIKDPAKRGYPFLDISCVDADGDGLPDGAERFATFTDPNLASTDGDRWLDGMEFFGGLWKDYVYTPGAGTDACLSLAEFRSMPAYVEADPLQPNVPEIAVRALSPELALTKTRTVDSTKVTQTDKVTEFKNDSGLTHKADAFARLESSLTLVVETSLEAGTKGFGASWSTNLTWETTASAGGGWAMDYTNSRFRVDTDTTTNSETETTTETWDESATDVVATIEVENIGNDILRCPMDSLKIAFYLQSAFTEGKSPLGFWEPDLTKQKIVNLKPGETKRIGVASVRLDLESYDLVAAGESIVVVVEQYSFGPDELYLANARASSAIFNVDYGNGEVIRRYVAIPIGGSPFPGAFSSIGDMTLTQESGVDVIQSVDGRDVRLGEFPPYSIWDLRISQDEEQLTGGTPTGVADARIARGDIVVMKYRLDSDGDLISNEDESYYGLHPLKRDSDEDELEDGDEIFGARKNAAGEPIFTDPRYWDTDADGASDLEEIEAGTNPAEPRTSRSAEIVRHTGAGSCVIYGDDGRAFVRRFTFDCGVAARNGTLAVGNVVGGPKSEIVVANLTAGSCRVYDARSRLLAGVLSCGAASGGAIAVGRLSTTESPFDSIVATSTTGSCLVWQRRETTYALDRELPCRYTANDRGIAVAKGAIVIALADGNCRIVGLKPTDPSVDVPCAHNRQWNSIVGGNFAGGFALAVLQTSGCKLLRGALLATVEACGAGTKRLASGDLEAGGYAELATLADGICSTNVVTASNADLPASRFVWSLKNCYSESDSVAVGDVW